MRGYALVLAIGLFGISLAGCAGSGGQSGAVPSLTSASSGRGSASIQITIPSGSAKNSLLRQPAYISASTTQLLLDIRSGGSSIAGYPQTIGLTPSSPGCTAGSGSTVCTINANNLVVGSYVANLTLMDASSNPLSAAQGIAITIVAGPAVPVDVVLSGVPHSFTVTPVVPLFAPGSQATSYQLVGAGKESFVVNALDIDGNVIIGPGAPTLTATQTGGSLAVTVTAPTVAAPNMLIVAPPTAYGSGSATVTVTATYPGATNACTQTGAVCTAAISFGMQELLVVMYQGGAVSLYADAAGTMTLLKTLSLSSGLSALAIDANGNMFVANSSAGTVSEYAPPYTAATTVITMPAFVYPQALTTDSSGDVYVGAYNSFVYEFTPGSSMTTSTPSRTLNYTVSTVTNPNSLCTDPSGNLFVSNNQGTGGNLDEFASTGTAATHSVADGSDFAENVACDGLGNVYIARYSALYGILEVHKYTPGLVSAGVLSGTSTDPWSVWVDGANNAYVANGGGAAYDVLKFAAGSTSIALTLTSYGSESKYVAADGGGNVFVGDASGGIVYEYASGATTSGSNLPSTGGGYFLWNLQFSP
jgi:hypothetical protein